MKCLAILLCKQCILFCKIKTDPHAKSVCKLMCLNKTLFSEIKLEISKVSEFSDFDPYTKIENSENSGIVSRLVNLVDFVLFV